MAVLVWLSSSPAKVGRQLRADSRRRPYACEHDGESQQSVSREMSRQAFHECTRAPVQLCDAHGRRPPASALAGPDAPRAHARTEPEVCSGGQHGERREPRLQRPDGHAHQSRSCSLTSLVWEVCV